MKPDLLYQLALTITPNIGCVVAKNLAEQFETAADIFKAKETTLSKLEGIGTVRAKSIKSFNDFAICEDEIKFIEKHHIQPLFLTDAAYPKRLLQCYDAPTLLFYKGEADLNVSRSISIIGTRNSTEYGKSFTEKFIADLAAENISIISGLAFGIDTIAHRAALKNNLSTIAALAHGLDTIYPPENKGMAKQMAEEAGGLITEFWSGTKPDKHNFPIRNRLVAGMTDATVVIETDIKGGSMITATLANNYNKDVFAVPGKTTDAKSKGCNLLIRQNKAALITSAEDFLEQMNWLAVPEKKKRIQRQLFIELSPEEKIIHDILNVADQIHIDELNIKSGLNSSAAAGALLSLELQGIVISMPGKLYKLA
jgi:DNA processing protein